MIDVVYGNNASLVDSLIPLVKDHTAAFFGPSYIAAVLEFFFFGLLCNQVWSYYDCFPKDSKFLQGLVGISFGLSALRALQSFMIVWANNIVHFADWHYAFRNFWYQYIETSTACLLSVVAQVYFIWRCYGLMGKNWSLSCTLLAGATTVLALSIVCTAQKALDPFYFPGYRGFMIPQLATAVGVDLAITLVLWFKLPKDTLHADDEEPMPQLIRWLDFSWEFALPPLLSAITTLIVFTLCGQFSPWHLIFTTLTSRLYIFSMMSSLNSRADPTLFDHSAPSSSHGSGFSQPKGPGGAARPRDAKTLSAFQANRMTSTFDPMATNKLQERTTEVTEASMSDDIKSGYGGVGDYELPPQKVRWNAKAGSEDGKMSEPDEPGYAMDVFDRGMRKPDSVV